VGLGSNKIDKRLRRRPGLNEPSAAPITLIDRQLTEAGWSVQDKRAINLFAAQGVAVREVTLKPSHGRADCSTSTNASSE
jgi:type I site-specific restriction endonuclease